MLDECTGVSFIGVSGDPVDSKRLELAELDTQIIVMTVPQLLLQFGGKLFREFNGRLDVQRVAWR